MAKNVGHGLLLRAVMKRVLASDGVMVSDGVVSDGVW